MSTTPRLVIDRDGRAATHVDWLTDVDFIAIGRLGGKLRAPDSGVLSFAAWSEGATPLEGFRRIRAALPVGQPMLASPEEPTVAPAMAFATAVAPGPGEGLPPVESTKAIESEATAARRSYERSYGMGVAVLRVLVGVAVTGGDTSAAPSTPPTSGLRTPPRAPATRCAGEDGKTTSTR
jgi:hypothetical protein